MKKIWPKDYSKTEIINEVNQLWNAAEKCQLKPGRVMFLLQRAQLGVDYLGDSRQKNFNRWVIGISISTLLVTAMFSVLDYFGDKNWQFSN